MRLQQTFQNYLEAESMLVVGSPVARSPSKGNKLLEIEKEKNKKV